MQNTLKNNQKIQEPVLKVDTLESLSNIKETPHDAIIWQRDACPVFLDWLDQLPPEKLPNSRRIVPVDDIASRLEKIFNQANTPQCLERDVLIQDMVEVAEHFAKIMSIPFLRLRLDVVQTNACKKFHLDYLTARLVCTYRGTGTEYGISHNKEIPNETFNVPTGAPFLMKGKLWTQDTGSTLLHRSPQIEGTGETRLVLVLDPVIEFNDEDQLI